MKKLDVCVVNWKAGGFEYIQVNDKVYILVEDVQEMLRDIEKPLQKNYDKTK